MLHADTIRSAPMVIVDANIPVDTIHTVCSLCHESKVPGMCGVCVYQACVFIMILM